MRACGPASRAGAKDPNFVAIIERRAVSAVHVAASDFHNVPLAAFHRRVRKRAKGRQGKNKRDEKTIRPAIFEAINRFAASA